MRISIIAATCRGWSAADFGAASSAPRARGISARLILPDSAHIQEEDARQANRQRLLEALSRALPLYTELDAARTLTQLQPVGYEPSGAGRARRRGRVHQRRPPARIGIRAPDRRQDPPVWRRPWPLRPSGAAGSDAGRGGRRAAPRVDLWRPAPPARRWRRAAGGRSSTRRWARWQGDHPVVCGRPRRGGAVLAAACSKQTRRIPLLPVYVDSPMAAGALQFYAQRVRRARSGYANRPSGTSPRSGPRA